MGEEWLEVDLNEEFTILGVGTLGDEQSSNWVATYTLKFKRADVGASWENVEDKQGDIKVRRFFE